MAPPAGKNLWLVTGGSSGLGASIGLSALKAGHFVLGTARSPDKAASSNPEFEKLGGKWLKLDVDDKDAAEIVQKAVDTELGGKIDVLINNAGWGKVGPIEDWSVDEVRQQFETNFFGLFRVTKAVIPYMRNQKSGTIANMSSLEGLTTTPANCFYSCSKHALEALSEGLQNELSPFGIRIALIEPGSFRTNIFAAGSRISLKPSEPYKETLGPVIDFVHHLAKEPRTLPGDPNKLGDRVVEFIDSTGMAKGLDKCFRLPLGNDAIFLMKRKIKALQTDLDATRHIAMTTQYDDLGPEADVYTSLFKDED